MGDKETPANPSTPKEGSSKRVTRASSREPESSARGTRRPAKPEPKSKSEEVGPAKKPRPSSEVKKETTVVRKSTRSRAKEALGDIPEDSSGQTSKTGIDEPGPVSGETSKSVESSSKQGGSVSQTQTGRASGTEPKSTLSGLNIPIIEVTPPEEISGESKKTPSPSKERKVPEESLMQVDDPESDTTTTPPLLKSASVTPEKKTTVEPSVAAVTCSSPPKKSPRSSDASDPGNIATTPTKSEAAKLTPEKSISPRDQPKPEMPREAPSTSSETKPKQKSKSIKVSLNLDPDVEMSADYPEPDLSKHLEAGPSTSQTAADKSKSHPKPSTSDEDDDDLEPSSTGDFVLPYEIFKRALAGDPTAEYQLASGPNPPTTPPSVSRVPHEELNEWDPVPCLFNRSLLSPEVREPRPLGSWISEYPEMSGDPYPIVEWQEPRKPGKLPFPVEVLNETLQKMGISHALNKDTDKSPKKVKKSKYVVTPKAREPTQVFTAILCNVPDRAMHYDILPVFVDLNLLNLAKLYKKNNLWIVDLPDENSFNVLMRHYDEIKVLDVRVHLILVGRRYESGKTEQDKEQKSYHAVILDVPSRASRERIVRDLNAQGLNDIEDIFATESQDPSQTTMKLTVTFKTSIEENMLDGMVLDIADEMVTLKLMNEFETEF